MFRTSRGYYKSIFRGARVEPKGFEFKPRYYDPDKERSLARRDFVRNEVKRAQERGEDFRISDRKSESQSFYGYQNKMARKQRSKKNMLALLALLVGLIFALLKAIRFLDGVS